MKQEVACSIVQDLLPNYIEKLTSDETNHMVEQHLNTCGDCKNLYEQMAADIDTPEKVPVIELKFLKKVKRIRLLAAILSIVLALVLSYLLYASEYGFTLDHGDLSAGITEFEPSVDAYVLETKEVEGVLIVSFKDQSTANVYGIAEFIKGFNQKYRIVRTHVRAADYSSVVQIYPIEIKKERYIAVSGYNLSDEIMYYGLDYSTYENPGYLSENRVRESVKFEVKNPQFLEIYRAEELDNRLTNRVEHTLSNYHLTATSVYDEAGLEITENFRIVENTNQSTGFGTGKAELFLLYIYIAIVLGLGIVCTRYFLTD